MKRFMHSLLAKYMLIIIIAIIVIQLAYLLVGSVAIFGFNMHEDEDIDASKVENKWHEDANNIDQVNEVNINNLFKKWKEKYPEAGMFWIDGEGKLVVEIDATIELPNKWTSVYTASFIKERYDGDPFTVIAFLENSESDGFIVLEISRTTFDPPILQASERFGSLILVGVFVFVLLFIVVSFLFFRSIQKRLLKFQDTMGIRDVDGLPIKLEIKKEDEIGELEKSYNQMVDELRDSRIREQKEEQLRRELIANLSHDLRTPLTKIRAQSYTITQEKLTEEGRKAVRAIEISIANIDRLIENLMSYTLLMASKYKYEPSEIDITRFIRESAATWYPAFEKEAFDINVSLESLGRWKIDPIWMGRILDNIFQNVLRHAKSGKYIGIKTESYEQYDAIIITDHGPGLTRESHEKGAEIGLTIVDMMVKGMELDWEAESSIEGTLIRIIRYR
ncbi:sensor histidine kinase KdpD [Paucisalibacillus sp. EB02]|uniref:sensor histidine kinase n=1 Tax=Paucisalibacillus sp. EB02 TaxID=1347087 RepID=UPI0005AB01F7|nr:HAMP domain-containing sensor histidine kinase [Paucisalibacillus sp. EB02]